MDVLKVTTNYSTIAESFPENSYRKNYFLSVCNTLDQDVDLEMIDKLCPYGGIIGIGDSIFAEKLFNWSKVFRLHAILHDGCGFMKTELNVGPGYCYMLPHFMQINSCFLGHLTGLSFCLYLKWCRSVLFDSLNC